VLATTIPVEAGLEVHDPMGVVVITGAVSVRP